MLNVINKNNLNWPLYSNFKRCGLITVSENLSTFVLNCGFCEKICLELDSFTNHIKSYHKSVIVNAIESEIEKNEDYDNDSGTTDNFVMKSDTEHAEFMDEETFIASDYDESLLNETDKFSIKNEIPKNESEEFDNDEQLEFAEIELVHETDSDDISNSQHSDSEFEDFEVLEETKISSLYRNIDLNSPENHPLLTHIIDGFKANPTLWDNDHPKYFSQILKKRALHGLSKQIQKVFKIKLEPHDIRQLFRRLRLSYKHSKISDEDFDTQNGHKLWYYEHMSFLDRLMPKLKPELSITPGDEIKIAEIYRNYPALWDVQNMKYRSKKLKDAAFKEMLIETNEQLEFKLTPEQLGDCIRIIRKYYIKNRRHRMKIMENKLSRKVELKPPHPEYQEILVFLDGHVGPFDCEICGETTLSYNRYMIHLKKHPEQADKARKIECDICHKNFKTLHNLRIHIRTHTGEMPFSCEVCGRGFNIKSTLSTHMRVHTGDRPYICDVCGKTYKTRSAYAHHKSRHGPVEFRFQCNMCPKKLPDKRHLREHMNAHLERREHVCQICNKGFFARKTLRQHEQLHLEEKKHICNICGKAFAQRAGLSSHLQRFHHLNTMKPQMNPNFNILGL